MGEFPGLLCWPLAKAPRPPEATWAPPQQKDDTWVLPQHRDNPYTALILLKCATYFFLSFAFKISVNKNTGVIHINVCF